MICETNPFGENVLLQPDFPTKKIDRLNRATERKERKIERERERA